MASRLFSCTVIPYVHEKSWGLLYEEISFSAISGCCVRFPAVLRRLARGRIAQERIFKQLKL